MSNAPIASAATTPAFLTLPERAPKPRDTGLTHVIDKGHAIAQIESLFAGSGDYVDIVKLGWGTSYVTKNLREKLALYRDLGASVVLGGTLLEVAIAQGKVDEYRRWVNDLGLTHVEISDGAVTIPHDEKLALIRSLAQDFTVLSEVGSKDDQVVIAPYKWVAMITAELEAGSWKVIMESRETGTAGLYRPDGEIRTGLVDEVTHYVDRDRLLFEAPQKAHQVWFVQQFGPNVNLGNIPPEEVIALETLRLGLRADTIVTGE
jgi:phosphosulfolactate synthase